MSTVSHEYAECGCSIRPLKTIKYKRMKKLTILIILMLIGGISNMMIAQGPKIEKTNTSHINNSVGSSNIY